MDNNNLFVKLKAAVAWFGREALETATESSARRLALKRPDAPMPDGTEMSFSRAYFLFASIGSLDEPSRGIISTFYFRLIDEYQDDSEALAALGADFAPEAEYELWSGMVPKARSRLFAGFGAELLSEAEKNYAVHISRSSRHVEKVRRAPTKRVSHPGRIGLDQFVYFIQSEHGGPIKIGTSTDVNSRLMSLQTGHAHKLVLLASMPGGRNEEKELHRRFAWSRMSGEWFECTDELLAFIVAASKAQDAQNDNDQAETG